MSLWLVKADPVSDYSYDDLVRDGRTDWDGVRNYQARNNLKAMMVGDLVLMYHSQSEKRVVGVGRIARAAYQDPTTDDDRWVAVEIEPVEKLGEPVTLSAIKDTLGLQGMVLVKHSRLSVMPVAREEFAEILRLGGCSATLMASVSECRAVS